jgi:hypothetical protein
MFDHAGGDLDEALANGRELGTGVRVCRRDPSFEGTFPATSAEASGSILHIVDGLPLGAAVWHSTPPVQTGSEPAHGSKLAPRPVSGLAARFRRMDHGLGYSVNYVLP